MVYIYYILLLFIILTENIRNEFTEDALVASLENVIEFNQSKYQILNECLKTLVTYSCNSNNLYYYLNRRYMSAINK